MSAVQNVLKISLVSKRRDIINFTETMCSERIKLTVVSDFSKISASDAASLLIDASMFYDFDFDKLEYGKMYAEFSICILPADIPAILISYVEKYFKYLIYFPINAEYFRNFCVKAMNYLANVSKQIVTQTKIRNAIPDSFSGYFCGNSEIIKKIRSQILYAAETDDPVLILGETGTGKTTAANVIHNLSSRKEKKIVSVSLSTIVETLAESSFFGHSRGSYTDAECECKGYFEIADGSTLFLDELGVAPLSLQAMLLTVLETGNFKRIGDNKEQHADVRMIFATNSDIESMLRNGSFRQDLYFRICDNLIQIPPLRTHKEDIREMVSHYLKDEATISESAIEKLENYSWPGNIRELHKCLRRAMMISNNKLITPEMIDFGDISFLQ